MQQVTIRADRFTIDVPDYGSRLDADNLRTLVTRAGSHFFDRDAMRAFRSRMDDYTYAAPDGWYFVTSEKHVAHTSYASINEPRMYTVRFLDIHDNDLRLSELEAFQYFPTLQRARTAAKRAAQKPANWCLKCQYRLSTGVQCHECFNRR